MCRSGAGSNQSSAAGDSRIGAALDWVSMLDTQEPVELDIQRGPSEV